MAHREWLNVLLNIIQKLASTIFSEFEGHMDPEPWRFTPCQVSLGHSQPIHCLFKVGHSSLSSRFRHLSLLHPQNSDLDIIMIQYPAKKHIDQNTMPTHGVVQCAASWVLGENLIADNTFLIKSLLVESQQAFFFVEALYVTELLQ